MSFALCPEFWWVMFVSVDCYLNCGALPFVSEESLLVGSFDMNFCCEKTENGGFFVK